MAMMKTISIIQQEDMAPVGKRIYSVAYRGPDFEPLVAVVYVEHKAQADSVSAALNRIRRKTVLKEHRPIGFFRRAVGPDHRWLGWLAPRLMQ